MSLEGGERGSYFRVSGTLTRGAAVVVPPEHWRLVTSTQGITVQATARGDCKGLHVAESRLDRIVVRENGQGQSNVEFDLLLASFFLQGIALDIRALAANFDGNRTRPALTGSEP
jgi:hypothetical protein